MNSTVVDSHKLAKVKRLNLSIEKLKITQSTFGNLTERQQLKLENKERKLNNLIKTL